ncbi:MAG: selenocysteine-specific translation elongation factor [Acidobacteria bacterium]|nr:selenocysteine-specific translation elongation factor [Acidobacteriota bacterium]NIM63577.1 selenocysteine-specific translation elongation factor [Acidobacteriota bacterium]NIO58439.1 selenocysteine-specific translation elongation factor [Acidobacteriota bacterium]NIQ29494.1 selenocysteine-specific translation elongation factor [Acidobacteriota bacterium]NIQ84171.1 selenocysteine-specific translation elongation factor [Acidobacteriota bacterium]
MSEIDPSRDARHRVIGTAGHIDHGKSALVLALTGTDPDRLKEEKRRGITIELGFADTELAPGDVVSFVDVPGHERFVRHMVAGATGIDSVLLVIALDQGVQPQTREHLEICSLLGLKQGVVALTKKDLVDEDLAEVVALEVRELLHGTFLEDAAMIAVSAKNGEGIDALRAALAALDRRVETDTRTIPRLPVDRSFVQRGFGTVVTGTMTGPGFREGEEVEIQPAGKRARIRGLQVHRQKVAAAAGGRRTACNLQGIECEEVPRGSVVCPVDALQPTTRFWAKLQLLSTAPKRLADGGPVRLHHGTADYAARFRVIGRNEDGSLRAIVFTSSPVPVVAGDRVVLRRPAPVDTVGGGVVVDSHPPHPRYARPEDFAEGAWELSRTARVRLDRAAAEGLQLSGLARTLGCTPANLEQTLRSMQDRQEVFYASGRWFGADIWNAVRNVTTDTLERFHAEEPLRLGIDREGLRARVAKTLPQEAWRVLLDSMALHGVIELRGDQVCLAGHEVVLDDGRDAQMREIEEAFRKGGLTPPEPADVASGGSGSELIGLLVARGTLVKLHDGKVFHADALDALRKKLWEFAEQSRMIDVGAFKELTGLTRKHAIPLLEHFDAENTTRRVGNKREILPPR